MNWFLKNITTPFKSLSSLVPTPEFPWPSFLQFYDSHGKKKGFPWEGKWCEWEQLLSNELNDEQSNERVIQRLKWTSKNSALEIFTLEYDGKNLLFYRHRDLVFKTSWVPKAKENLEVSFWYPLIKKCLNNSFNSLRKSAEGSHVQQVAEQHHELGLANEQKALTWLKTTHQALRKGIKEVELKKDLLLTGSFLFGELPQTTRMQYQLKLFNVESILISPEKKYGDWNLVVYDHSKSKDAVFSHPLHQQTKLVLKELEELTFEMLFTLESSLQK